jgi:shikimate dehydrogenase
LHSDKDEVAAVPVRGTTRVVGVFGYPVRHSASPPMHNAAFKARGLDWVYVPFEVAPENLGVALAGVRALGMAGVNVTVPLKEQVAPFLDEVTERARLIGSVNTVVNENGRLSGDSTDGPGFLAALGEAGVEAAGRKVVVLGAGGSARAVVHALAEAGAQVVVANRTPERARAMAERFASVGRIDTAPLTEEALRESLRGAAALVNTTSAGMHPQENEMPPVPVDALEPPLFVSDLIYNPAETRLLALARARGCRVQNGVEMLVQQGAVAFHLWTGIKPPVAVMRAAVLNAVRR